MSFGGGFGHTFGAFTPPLHQPSHSQSNPWPSFYQPIRITSSNVCEIRLLEIISTPAAPNATPGGFFGFAPSVHPGMISVRLTNVWFDSQTPPFVALSYNWGDQNDKTSILCNNTPFGVGKSLHGALIALHGYQKQRYGQRYYFWIDALCIDQQNDEEKGQQVPLMNELYRKAAHVLVWLGEPDACSQVALPFMNLCAAASAMIGKISAHQLTPQDWYRLGFAMTEQQRNQGIRAFCMFLARPWFKRVWIIQEFAVPTSVTCLCGPYEFQPEQIFAAYDFLTITEVASITFSKDSEGGVGTIEYLRSIRANWKAGQRLPLLILLRDHQPFHSSQWKDKIYALMQMASDVGTGPADLNILVSYEQEKYIENGKTILVDIVPLETVYRSVAIEMLQKQRSLDVVSCAGTHDIWTTERRKPYENEAYHERLSELPSWVPDWHRPDSTPHPQRFERRMHVNLGSVNATEYLMARNQFKASRDSVFNYREPTDANKLQVRAMLLDSISVLGKANHMPFSNSPAAVTFGQPNWMVEPPLEETMRQIEFSCTVFEDWVRVVGAHSNQVYFTGESMLDVLWQTMLGGVFANGIDADRMLFMQWYQTTRTATTITLGLRESPKLRAFAAGAYTVYKKATQGPKHLSNFLYRTAPNTSNKAIFRTAGTANSFGYVGLAPRGIMQGDVVAILEGGNVPFVLRQKDRFWEVVGACYVHGVMFGQIFNSANCRDIVLV